MYILPAKEGRGFLLAILALFALCLTYGHPVLFILMAFCISTLMVAAILTNSSVQNIVIKNKNLIFVADFLHDNLLITLINEGRENRFDIHIGHRKLSFFAEIPKIAGKSVLQQKFVHEMEEGIFQILRMKVSSSFPFGLFRSWKYIDVDFKLYIFPQISESESLAEDLGREEGHFFQEADDGDTISSYIEGHDQLAWRNIDWKIFAKNRKYVERLREQEVSPVLLIDLPTLRPFDRTKIARIGRAIKLMINDGRRVMIKDFSGKKRECSLENETEIAELLMGEVYAIKKMD